LRYSLIGLIPCASVLKRTFVTNLILLVGLNLLVKPFYLLVVEAEIQNRVGADVFGSYFALLSFSFILNILPDLGTTNWNTRHTAQSEQVISSHLSGMIVLRFLLAAFYLLISFAIGLWLQYTSWQMWLLVLLSINQLLAGSILFFRSYLTGLHLFKQDSVVSVLDRLILLVAMSLLLWGSISNNESFRLEWLVYGQTASYLITLIVVVVLVLRKSGKLRFAFDKKFFREVLRDSAPFTVMTFLSMVAYRIDGVMLERIDSSYEAGVYAMCYRFYEAINMISYLFAVLLLPMFARMLSRRESISDLLQLSFKVMFTGLFLVAVSVFFFGENILALVYDHHIAEATPVFIWLMASMVCFSLQYIFGTLITAAGNLRPLIFTALSAMIYNVLLNSFYIPQMGALGAAKASFFTQLMVLLAQVLVVTNRFNIGDFKSTLFKSMLFATGCILVGIIFSTQTIMNLPIAYNIGFFLIGSFLVMVLTKILDIKRFIALIKTRE